jgi:predicted nuclease of predicted toxin-antitoxin system
MYIVFDENVPKKLVEGLQTLAPIASDTPFEITSVKLLNKTGISDATVLEMVKENGILITYDADFRTQRHLYSAIKKYNIGLFWIKQGKKTTFWTLVQLMIQHWQKILEICESEERPFLYEVNKNGVERKEF